MTGAPQLAPEPAARGWRWSEAVDEILDGDHVVMLAHVTPAQGVVLTPINNFAMRDREAGTIAANSSVGAWRKLERIGSNPKIALAYHTRTHGASDRGEFVLVQGHASLSPPIPDYPATVAEHWARFERWPPANPLWRWWQRIYALRVQIDMTVERMIVWPDLECRGPAEVIGSPLEPCPPVSQRPPKLGSGPRLDPHRAARRAARLPERLLGWVGADGYPLMLPVTILGANDDGIELLTPSGIAPPGLTPAESRRAGFTAHRFSRGAIGQHQRKHTGWLGPGGEPGRLLYAPHTQAGYHLPASRTLYRIASGGSARMGLRDARRTGVL